MRSNESARSNTTDRAAMVINLSQLIGQWFSTNYNVRVKTSQVTNFVLEQLHSRRLFLCCFCTSWSIFYFMLKWLCNTLKNALTLLLLLASTVAGVHCFATVQLAFQIQDTTLRPAAELCYLCEEVRCDTHRNTIQDWCTPCHLQTNLSTGSRKCCPEAKIAFKIFNGTNSDWMFSKTN